MIRDFLDTAWLEDFLDGLTHTTGLGHYVFHQHGGLVARPEAHANVARERELTQLPADLNMSPLAPADAPPAEIGFVTMHDACYVIAPIYIDDHRGGFVAIGPFADADGAGAGTPLPRLERIGSAPGVVGARWTARMLTQVCQREARLITAGEEISMLGDVAELLHGDADLQAVLNRIVTETARVINCRFCMLRLHDETRGELRLQAVHNLSPAYIQRARVFPDDNPIDREALQGRIVYVEDARSDPRMPFPEDVRREGIVSGLTAGLIYRGRPVGVLRVYTDRKVRFRRAQHKLLRAVAYQAASAIVHAQLVEERIESLETQRQLELAGDLQARMMQARPPFKQQVQTASIYQQSHHVGGDFCDFFLLPDGRLAATVADVVGKQIKASLLATYVRGALRATAHSTADLGEMITCLNQQLCGDTLPSEFVTLLILAIDEDGRSMDYVCAGHEPVLRWRDGRIDSGDDGGLVLGVDPSASYVTSRLDLAPQDACLLYTDGAIEAMNFAGELYGRERLAAALAQHGALELATALRAIQWDIRRFSGLVEQSDDLTLVGLRITQ